MFDHVGITVADLDSVTAFFADLGFGRQAVKALTIMSASRSR